MRKAESRRAAVTMTARALVLAGEPAHELEAVRVAQRVGDDAERGRARRLDALKERRAVGEDLDLVAGARELRFEERAVVWIGVDDEHTLAAVRAQDVGGRAQIVDGVDGMSSSGTAPSPTQTGSAPTATGRGGRSSPSGAGQPTASNVTGSPPRICGPRNSAA